MKKHQSCNQILKCFCENKFIIIILAIILLMGEEILEWILCDEKTLIWIVLLILLLTNCEFDCC